MYNLTNDGLLANALIYKNHNITFFISASLLEEGKKTMNSNCLPY